MRLLELPKEGRIVVASTEGLAQYAAFELGLDYFLDPYIPACRTYVLDVSRLWQLEHEWLTEHPSSQG